jgi:hypothetical protein
MILSQRTIDYFSGLQARVSQAMAKVAGTRPYFVEHDPVIANYEILREIWVERGPIKAVCQRRDVSRSQYYELETRFLRHGLAGIFPDFKTPTFCPELERLVLLVKASRPSLSQQSIFRVAQAVPLTRRDADIDLIGQILKSHGLAVSNRLGDKEFWGRVQRVLEQSYRLKQQSVKGRNKRKRTKTFFSDDDPCHKRLELLRELFFNSDLKIKERCIQYGIAPTSYYRLVEDYRLWGPWAVIPASLPGKEAVSNEWELRIVLEKLHHPELSAQEIVRRLKLRCSRFTINRVFGRWDLKDKKRSPIALDRHVEGKIYAGEEPFRPLISAYHVHSEQKLLESRRINREFDLLCRKMQTHAYHLCDPGPLLLAPFVNDLGIMQAFESYGQPRLRGKDLSNLALLNVFRIIGGYRRINHLSDNRDRSVALASGLGMFGTRSRFYEDTLEFKFDQLHSLRCDLIARAKELNLVEGVKIAFDFHLKQFYGQHSEEKGIGKGPNKSGDMVPGFRPHVAWDLATNTILSMTYFHGGVRSTGIVEQFCEQHIFSIFDPEAIREIYMDSEYTKEALVQYFKRVTGKKGEVYLCLKRNKQIKKLTASALAEAQGWDPLDKEDEIKSLTVVLPKTGLPLKIVIIRDLATRKNIRCFGTTRTSLSSLDLLKKYRYRWLIENGLKDLVYSYFLDEIYGKDPEKIEFEFYCVMIARLAYEYFLKELGDGHYRKEDGNRTTLQTMRCLLFEKRNFTMEVDSRGDFILTLLDSAGNDLEKRVAQMLDNMMDRGKNKVLWWKNRGIRLRFNNQYEAH